MRYALAEFNPFGVAVGNTTLSKLRSVALELSESDRAKLAYDLLSSLDGPPDKDADQAWDREISSRLDEIDSGKATMIKADEAIQRIKQRLATKR